MNRPILSPAETARILTVQARSLPRDPRSAEYWAGVETAAARRLARSAGESLPTFAVPFRLGTAQADAFLAGTDEGHRIAERALSDRPTTP